VAAHVVRHVHRRARSTAFVRKVMIGSKVATYPVRDEVTLELTTRTV